MTRLSLTPTVTTDIWARGLDATLTRGATVHLPPSDPGSCINPVALGHVVPAEAAVVGVEFCVTCWPARRCAVCGDPSGNDMECGPCTTQAMDAELAYERAQEWAA